MPSSYTSFRRICIPIAAFVALSAQVLGQAPAPKPDTPGKPADQTKPAKPETPAAKPGEPKPYKEVITKEAKTQKGLFLVHQIGDKVYYEIPTAMLDRVMLWTTEIAKVPTGVSYGGTAAADREVEWELRENKVYLRLETFDIRAQDSTPAIDEAIRDNSEEPIVMAFNVEAYGKDKAPVIDVTRLVNTDVAEFSAKTALGAGGIDPARSYLQEIKVFPRNIETLVTLTFTAAPPKPSSLTTLIHYSLNLLPRVPMMARLGDSRVGFFTEDYQDYGTDEHRVVPRSIIARYRLEKTDPTAAVSDPKKPIVYYISREVPEKWRPYLKLGVEDWRAAFDQAGFSNAISCKDAPSVKEDPNWDPEDARYSVIRWAPTDTENAMGPHVHDPRSGEIISAHIIVWHNVLKLAEQWYFVQASPNDPNARHLPLPDATIGNCLRYIICHEVGHTLGLQHNFKASSAFTIAQLRSKDFTDKWGDEASIMDYGRFNYVAQPGDNARLIPKLGPYDFFAIKWGYTPFPGAHTPEAEKPMTDAMAARQLYDPTIRFGNSHFEDPGQQMEDLSNDPIEATRLGLKNVARVAQFLVPASTKFGEDYSVLSDTYSMLVNQRFQELTKVAAMVGGVVETDYHAGRGGSVFVPVPAARQAQAMEFLVTNALQPPTELLRPDILYRIEPSGVQDQVVNQQRGLVAGLLSEVRIKRMLDAEALNPAGVYHVDQLVSAVQTGIFSEIALPVPTTNIYRRNLQRAYLQIAKDRLDGPAASQTDLRPIMIAALKRLAPAIDKAIPRCKDSITAQHLQDCRKTIERILIDPKGDTVTAAIPVPALPTRRRPVGQF